MFASSFSGIRCPPPPPPRHFIWQDVVPKNYTLDKPYLQLLKCGSGIFIGDPWLKLKLGFSVLHTLCIVCDTLLCCSAECGNEARWKTQAQRAMRKSDGWNEVRLGFCQPSGGVQCLDSEIIQHNGFRTIIYTEDISKGLWAFWGLGFRSNVWGHSNQPKCSPSHWVLIACYCISGAFPCQSILFLDSYRRGTYRTHLGTRFWNWYTLFREINKAWPHIWLLQILDVKRPVLIVCRRGHKRSRGFVARAEKLWNLLRVLDVKAFGF